MKVNGRCKADRERSSDRGEDHRIVQYTFIWSFQKSFFCSRCRNVAWHHARKVCHDEYRCYVFPFKKHSGKLDIQGLWIHSLGIALALRTISRAMPRNTRPLDDEIFLAGLLHDIGYMVLNQLDQNRSDELHTRFASQKERNSNEIEAEFLEMNHGELGAELVRHWDLPESVVAILRYHHDSENEHAAAGQPLVSMVNLAEKILPSFGINEHNTPDILSEEWTALGIDPAKAEVLIAEINLQAEEARQTAGSFP